MTRELDVVIFGATGFTGKYTVLHAVKLLSDLKWGIAGRSQQKLESVLKEIGKKADTDLSKIPIIIADVGDELSLEKMARQTKIVVNCCGPYRFYGEAVIKACIKESTHHVDVSGEPQFMERMQLEYNELARENEVYIVSACGFDSIPADLGTVFFEKTFDGQVNAIESFMWFKYVGPGTPEKGAALHYGTWESAVYGLAHANELRGLRKKLFKERVPVIGPVMRERTPYTSYSVGGKNAYCLPFPGADRSVVTRSQRLMYEEEKKAPVQIRNYFTVSSFLGTLMMIIIGAVFALLSKYAFGRQLLLKYPKLFSFGAASHEGPPEQKMNNTQFIFLFKGNGWNERSSDYKVRPNGEPVKTHVTKVTGLNPGYGATCISVLLSATTILNESSRMPGKGGVLPPGYAFGKTNLIDNLCKNGFTFEVVDDKDADVSEEKKSS